MNDNNLYISNNYKNVNEGVSKRFCLDSVRLKAKTAPLRLGILVIKLRTTAGRLILRPRPPLTGWAGFGTSSAATVALKGGRRPATVGRVTPVQRPAIAAVWCPG